MDDEAEQGYTWEGEYERPWEAIQEDHEGHIVAPNDDELYKAKRRKLFDHRRHVKLGMMRHVIVVLDLSSPMEDKDLRPDRLTCSKAVLENFFNEFFDHNPISPVGLLVTRDGKAEKVTDLTGNPKVHKEGLVRCTMCSGEASLQNAMILALKTLRHIPSHASREVIIVHGSLTSCDPDNIFSTIEEYSKLGITCSIVGVSAEVRLCKTIATRTQGTYHVALDETHFKDLLLQHCRPPPAKTNSESALIKMGFPHHNSLMSPSVCMCHLDSRQKEYVTTSGYTCPQCASKYCELPVECKICGLTLVLAPHLARSYHHLFPLSMFQEIKINDSVLVYCTGCRLTLKDEVYMCPDCEQPFCIDCDLYCHETLHNCPGCESKVSQP